MIATMDEIKQNYRKLSLKYHPDKLSHLNENDKESYKLHFLKIQKAYECLSNPTKRKKYDAKLPFDDKIPDDWTIEKVDNNINKFFETFS